MLVPFGFVCEGLTLTQALAQHNKYFKIYFAVTLLTRFQDAATIQVNKGG
jgi:hypothetical protein